MQKSYNYTCFYCQIEYKPTKRGRQKFCSTSCRVANFNANKKLKQLPATEKTPKEIVPEKKYDAPKVNMADITNAALGNVASNLLINMFTPKNQKAATKQDLADFKAHYNGGRFRPVLNCPPNELGQTAYFDLEKNEVIFSYQKLY
ncbi:hypothetical protein [Bizionia arctica]|uniref:Uncharacterized protein n=1 Tax=Bizionia arctica TaxID=1495645 RepID=A0A917G9N4_9FLAO|nr:hypothetical protein [Bizionia arctica]GGG32259.1 hypothetical protein GCM10010976_00070 [Bizionia arctica]